jgi:transcriptional regulator with XRE-family HTH domain
MDVAEQTETFSLAGLGRRIRDQRQARGWSLEQLAVRSGVSRSMLYEVEGGRKSATVTTLVRIATGLETSLAHLVDTALDSRIVCLPRETQTVVRDPAGWERRTLSPAIAGIQFELVRLTLEPGATAGPFRPHPPGSREFVVVDAGELEVTIDGDRHLLRAGDAVYYAADATHAFSNQLDVRSSCLIAMDLG